MGESIVEFGISVYTVLYLKWISNKDEGKLGVALESLQGLRDLT